ncbi:MAG: helix-turn-helix transcriptional regulator [Prevotella sp.]
MLTLAEGRQRRLAYFASRLNVTEHYLSLAVKQATGSTAKDFIDNSVITEIKILLRLSDLTILEISHRLDFPSDSFLCRYFKRLTGMTPLEYRSANH